MVYSACFCFQAEDGIRDLVRSRGLGDVYKRQGEYWEVTSKMEIPGMPFAMPVSSSKVCVTKGGELSLIHI